MPDGLLTANELGAELRVKPDTVKHWSRTGRIPTVRITPKVIRYDLQAVIASLKSDSSTRCPKGAAEQAVIVVDALRNGDREKAVECLATLRREHGIPLMLGSDLDAGEVSHD
ncbi:MAG: hypothetical protein O3C40_24720 [Planctomycetota bacterium]|nr:hypothetical protein [Planctomycetota bacterium]